MLGEVVLGGDFKRGSTDFKNLEFLDDFCKALYKIVYMLTFSCTSFRSASLDVEPIYTFRAHTWVFAKNIIVFSEIEYFWTEIFLKIPDMSTTSASASAFM